MLSGHPPERLEVELQSLVGPTLTGRGYRMVGAGPHGVTWRREPSGKFIAGLIVLGLLALGGLFSGEAASTGLGVLCLVGAAALFYFRRPATVSVTLSRGARGTEVTVTGGPDATRAEAVVKRVIGPAPDAPERPDATTLSQLPRSG